MFKGKKGKSGKKTDWDGRKMEFMLSPYISISEWIRETGLPASSTTWRNTKGWAEEKEKKRREIYEQVQEETLGKYRGNLEKAYRNLMNAGIFSRLSDPRKLEKMSIMDIEKLWKIMRTENGMPTAIRHIGEDASAPFQSPVTAEDVKNLTKEEVNEHLRNILSEGIRGQ